jgi:hypothetical protein
MDGRHYCGVGYSQKERSPMEKIGDLKRPDKIEKEITSFSCEAEMKEKLWAIADANNVGLSDVIRYGLSVFLKGLEKQNAN